jgi:hypothetical protein
MNLILRRTMHSNLNQTELTMDTLLILCGLLLIVFGMVWLIMLAFGSSLFWGLGSFFPPVTLLYVVRYWRTARKAVIFTLMGFIPLVVGLVLLAGNDQARFTEIASLRWLATEQLKPNELAIDLHGQLNGEPFAPQHAELIDGVLTLREGEDFFARREVKILLPRTTNNSVHLNVLPTDAQPLPEIEISWMLPEHDLPEARRLGYGYTLYAKLKPLAPNKMAGEFHLVLPTQFNTALSGTLELFTNNLRYLNGTVNRHVDSRDTINYVIEDYMQRRFTGQDVRLLGFPELKFPASSLEIELEALIAGQPQQETLLLSKSAVEGWSVQGDQFARLDATKTQVRESVPTVISESASVPVRKLVDRRLRFSLERLQRTPEQYRNLLLRLTTVHGSVAQGRFGEINADGRIVIRREVSGPGEASYILRPTEISQIELLEP